MNANPEPQLAPPGAGLPTLELWIGRGRFAWQRWTGSRELFNRHFEQERQRICALVKTCNEESRARRVLIKRVRGLEDSSRYWSVWMALDHLRIVNGSFDRIIRALTRGIVPEGRASTATVKPSPLVTAAVTAEYERACDALLATVAGVGDWHASLRYAHPWFGPLNASGWHALAGGHMGIHRAQIERILQGLRRAETED
jgi:hypothetical protein